MENCNNSPEIIEEGVLQNYESVMEFLRQNPKITDLFLPEEKLHLAQMVAGRTDINWSSIYRDFRENKVDPERRDLFSLKICTDKYYDMLSNVDKRKRSEIDSREPVAQKKENERYKFDDLQFKVDTPKQKGRRGETDTTLLVQQLENECDVYDKIRCRQDLGILREIKLLKDAIDSGDEQAKIVAKEKLDELIFAEEERRKKEISIYHNLSAQLKKVHETKLIPSTAKAIRTPVVPTAVVVEEKEPTTKTVITNDVTPPVQVNDVVSIEVNNVTEPSPAMVETTIIEPSKVEKEVTVVEIPDSQVEVKPPEESSVKVEEEKEQPVAPSVSVTEPEELSPNGTPEIVKLVYTSINLEIEESTSETIVEPITEETIETISEPLEEVKEEPTPGDENQMPVISQVITTEKGDDVVVEEVVVKSLTSPKSVTDSTTLPPSESEPSQEVKVENNLVTTPEVVATPDTPSVGNTAEKRKRKRRTHLTSNTIQTRSTRSQGVKSEPNETPVIKVERSMRGAKKRLASVEESSNYTSEESNGPKTPSGEVATPTENEPQVDEWVRTKGWEIFGLMQHLFSHLFGSRSIVKGYEKLNPILRMKGDHHTFKKCMDTGEIKTRTDFEHFTRLMVAELRLLSYDPALKDDIDQLHHFFEKHLFEADSTRNKRIRSIEPKVEVGQKRKTRRSNGNIEGIPRKYARRN